MGPKAIAFKYVLTRSLLYSCRIRHVPCSLSLPALYITQGSVRKMFSFWNRRSPVSVSCSWVSSRNFESYTVHYACFASESGANVIPMFSQGSTWVAETAVSKVSFLLAVLRKEVKRLLVSSRPKQASDAWLPRILLQYSSCASHCSLQGYWSSYHSLFHLGFPPT